MVLGEIQFRTTGRPRKKLVELPRKLFFVQPRSQRFKLAVDRMGINDSLGAVVAADRVVSPKGKTSCGFDPRRLALVATARRKSAGNASCH